MSGKRGKLTVCINRQHSQTGCNIILNRTVLFGNANYFDMKKITLEFSSSEFLFSFLGIAKGMNISVISKTRMVTGLFEEGFEEIAVHQYGAIVIKNLLPIQDLRRSRTTWANPASKTRLINLAYVHPALWCLVKPFL